MKGIKEVASGVFGAVVVAALGYEFTQVYSFPEYAVAAGIIGGIVGAVAGVNFAKMPNIDEKIRPRPTQKKSS